MDLYEISEFVCNIISITYNLYSQQCAEYKENKEKNRNWLKLPATTLHYKHSTL